MGKYTVLDCHDITSVSFTSSGTNTATASKTSEAPSLVTDYESTDIGNGIVYEFATAFVTTDTTNYGGLQDFTGVVETRGVGTATREYAEDHESIDGDTAFIFPSATGDGSGDLTPVGTATFERVSGYQTVDGETTFFYTSATGDGGGDLTPVGEPTATSTPDLSYDVPACGTLTNPADDSGHGKICWSRCNPDTAKPAESGMTVYTEGDPWCWLIDDSGGSYCSSSDDCQSSNLLHCQPWESFGHVGCNATGSPDPIDDPIN